MRARFLLKTSQIRPMHDWIMALEIVNIAIVQLMNTIDLPFLIWPSPNLDNSYESSIPFENDQRTMTVEHKPSSQGLLLKMFMDLNSQIDLLNVEFKQVDHDNTGHPYWRKLIQNTKKMNCPAAIHVRSVLKFPSYNVCNFVEWNDHKRVLSILY